MQQPGDVTPPEQNKSPVHTMTSICSILINKYYITKFKYLELRMKECDILSNKQNCNIWVQKPFIPDITVSIQIQTWFTCLKRHVYDL